MRPTLFISDLHLDETRPAVSELFFRFMDESVRDAGALYILGDLFEAWVGDDQLDHDPLAQRVAAGLLAVSIGGTKVYFMHGNRDFLIGERFAQQAGLTLLPDPTVIELRGERVLLMHGDTLCTDDTAYQTFRHQVRNPAWQEALLAKTYQDRLALALSIRSQSETEKSMKAEAIMDVNSKAVESAFRAHGCRTLVHGHTHRPARHDERIDGQVATRWVLPDWHSSAGGAIFAGPEMCLTVWPAAT